MDEEKYDELVLLLRYKKNVILQGPPGVGKTFAAKRLAHSMLGRAADDRVKLIQFHQNYSYEDFIMGYKPSEGSYTLQEGVFYRFCQEAQKFPDDEFFFIIDEINRGNLSKIFGEVLMLIEDGYRGHVITLPYDQRPFSVPENLYIIGMMNTADRSLAILDYALRRRFCFFDMLPAFDSDAFKKYQKRLDNDIFDRTIDLVLKLNKEIEKDGSLGEGFCIGHSYFCRGGKPEEWLLQVIKYELVPLLREYWFESPEKADEWEKRLCSVADEI